MCSCNGWRTGELVAGRPPAVGEHGLVLLEAGPAERTNHLGPVTGTRYRFDQRARLWVDVRDAVYFLGPTLRAVAI